MLLCTLNFLHALPSVYYFSNKCAVQFAITTLKPLLWNILPTTAAKTRQDSNDFAKPFTAHCSIRKIYPSFFLLLNLFSSLETRNLMWGGWTTFPEQLGYCVKRE